MPPYRAVGTLGINLGMESHTRVLFSYLEELSMQKRTIISAISLILVAILLVKLNGKVATASEPAQATKAATMAATMAGSAMVPGSGLIKGGVDAEAKRLNASGATFPLELYKKWTAEYKTLTGVEINYAGGGSGQGKKDISAGVVD